MNEKKQLKLNNFCEEFDIPRSTALKWIHGEGFPGYLLQGHWYVDVDEYKKWRKNQHIKNYKYT